MSVFFNVIECQLLSDIHNRFFAETAAELRPKGATEFSPGQAVLRAALGDGRALKYDAAL